MNCPSCLGTGLLTGDLYGPHGGERTVPCPDCGQATHCVRCRAELREDERANGPHDLCDDCALAATPMAAARCAVCLAPRPVAAGLDGRALCERCVDGPLFARGELVTLAVAS